MILLYPIAFLSGILTVFSPCIVPILPIILASGIDGNVWRARGIVSGIVVSFTVATLLLAAIVQVLGVPADIIRNFAIIVLILLGVSMVFPEIWEKFQIIVQKYIKLKPVGTSHDGFVGGFVTGISLGIIWTPCIGPIIAAVATLAALHALTIGSVFIVISYALGTAIPLYLIAKGSGSISSKLPFIREKSNEVKRIFGIIVLITAFLVFAGLDRTFQAWTLSTLPKAWTQLPTTFENRFDLDNNTSVSQVEPGSTIVRNVQLQDDFSGAKVDKNDLLQGCFGGKDCIPSIEDPKFVSASQAVWLNPDDVVFAISYKGIERAYPQRIMNWHEIVNDTVAQDPITITFCPLCGSAVAFERKVDGVITELGVSGKLHNSDLVMYDRYEGNLWQQITGEGIVGPAARRSEKLKQVPIITTTWGEWLAKHPNTEVLSLETGFDRDYSAYPYGTYEQDDDLYFGVEGLDKSMQIKTVVYGIEVNSSSKAYPESILAEQTVIEDTVGGVEVRIERQQDGSITVINIETDETIIPIRLFWFAWASFHPNTEVYSL